MATAPPPRDPPLLNTWAVAAVAAVVATVLAIVLEEPMGDPPVSLLFAAVMLSAWYGGIGPGLLTTALGGLALDYFFEAPRYEWSFNGPGTLLRLFIYASTASFISWLNAQRRAAAASAEEARIATQHVAAIVESLEDAVVGVDVDGRVTSWNAAAARTYGYRSGEMIGTPISSLAPPDEPDVLPRILDLVRQGDRFGIFDTVRLARDGRRPTVAVRVSPVRNVRGEIVGASLVERDVTEQRASAEAVERLAAIVRSSQDAILAKTLDGRITAWNPAAEELYGYASHEAIGCSIDMLVPPERRAELRRILDTVAANESVDQLETLRMRRDGRRVWVRLSVTPVHDAAGRVSGASAIARRIEAPI